MRKDEFSLKNLTRTFAFTPPAWLARVPLWTIALLLIAVPMLARILALAIQLPAPYGTLIGPADPDPWLRLSLVRDWLSGMGWYDHEVVRSNAPFGGISTPWTRPLDVVIALLVKLQFSTAPIHIELQRAALLMPFLWMLLLFGGLFRAMHLLKTAPSAIFITVALVGTMPVIWNYFGTGNADHHAPLCALWVWAITPFLAPEKSRFWVSGLILALMLWVSPEALVLIGVLYAFLGLAWLVEHPVSLRLPELATTTAYGTLAAVIIERPFALWTYPIYDTVSIVYVFILTLSAILAWTLYLASSILHGIRVRILTAAVGVAVLTLILWNIYPLAFKGPMAEVDEFIHAHFLPRITEAQSLFSERPLYVIAMLIQPVAATIICYTQWKHADSIYGRYHALLLLFLVLSTSTLYFMQQRWYYYFYPVVVIALAPWLAALMTPAHPAVKRHLPARNLAKLSESEQLRKRAPAVLTLFLLPITLLVIMPDRSTANSKRIDACQKEARILIYGAKLNDIAGGKPLNLLAPTDLGGEILFFTPHRIVASNYHREGTGIAYVWKAEKTKEPAELRRTLAERNIQAILFCPEATTPKDSFLFQLQQGKRQPPAWLKPVPFTSEAKPDERPLVLLVR